MTPWWKRWWVWGLAAALAFVVASSMAFPSGRYECIWQGERPDGDLGRGRVVVLVGRWPNTYPLEARIYNESLGMAIYDGDWTHAHSAYDREFGAVFPWKGDSYQAHCELPS